MATNPSNTNQCPCGSQKNDTACCAPFITGQLNPETPEALMRSRYSAYTLADIAYIKKTMRGNALLGFQEQEARRWAKRVQWIHLEVLATAITSASSGWVEFKARCVDGAHLKELHERSEFILDKGLWYYTGGQLLPTADKEHLISRISPCPCGSTRKFKNCHGQ